MATGRLASGSIAAGAATQLYRNSTGNAQVITLLASSQVSGKSPKLNVKITNENFTTTTSVTTVTSGTNHNISNSYPALSAQIAGEADGNSYSSNVTTSGNRLHLSIGEKNTANSMGQAWSKGYAHTNTPNTHPWGKVSFDGQPMQIGGSGGGNYKYDDANRYFGRYNQQCYDPYYFENPNAFNQKKARGVVTGNDGHPWYHLEDISKMPIDTLKLYYNGGNSAGANYYSHDDPGTDATKWGTRTSLDPSYYNRGSCYDLWTGLVLNVHSNGYSSGTWFDENSISTSHVWNYSSNARAWRWGNGAYDGSDPQSYDLDRHGSVYGCDQDIDHGLFISTPGRKNPNINFIWFEPWFEDDTMDNKDTRAKLTGGHSLSTWMASNYYHYISYQGNARAFKLQWVKYNPHTDKHYVCFWDNSGTYSDNPPSMGTSYPTEAGIFEVDVTKIYGYGSGNSDTRSSSFASEITSGMLTKVASVPDTVSGLMSKPMRIKDSLWVSHCQDGKHYFSTDLVTWEEQDSDTHFSTDYAMVNASKLGTAGTDETNYFVTADSTSIVYSFSQTVTEDVYDQAAVSGIMAKGAVTPYEQKAIILSDGDAIYVENEDATNAISITAMGVDV